jgi:hypothetical protein
MYELSKRTRAHGRKVMTELLLCRLRLGLTMCRLANTAKGEQIARYRSYASNALEGANKLMWSLGMDHPDFDEFTAQCERLKLELESPDQINPRSIPSAANRL